MDSTNRMDRNANVQWFTDDVVYAPLKSAGFRKSGKRFWRWRKAIVDVLDVQSSAWNVGSVASVTVNCGIDVEGAAQIRWGRSQSKVPTAAGAVIQSRIASLAPSQGAEHGDRWWELKPDATSADREQILRDVRDRIEDHTLPWFNRFATIADVAEYLIRQEWAPGLTRIPYRNVPQSHIDLRLAAICFALNGHVDRALGLLDLADRESRGRMAEDNREIRDRLLALERSGARTVS